MFNEITPKKSLHECFERLTEYEKGYIQHIRDSFVIEQKLDPSKSEYSQKVLVSYSFDCVNVNKILDYLAAYFDLFGYRLNFHIICGFSRDIMNIAIHKTARSKDFDLIPADTMKLEEERNKEDYDYIKSTAEEDEEEEPTNPRLMSADEVRDIADKKNIEYQVSVDSYLLRIGEAIGKAAKAGKYSVDFNLEYNTDTEVINKLSSYLESIGFTVNDSTAWNSTDGYYKKLTIEFYSK